jgi:hypothetical protein
MANKRKIIAQSCDIRETGWCFSLGFVNNGLVELENNYLVNISLVIVIGTIIKY